MNYTVIWLESAEAELLRLYAIARQAGHAEAFTRATARIEHLIATNPTQTGESRTGRQRIVIEIPITVEFEVHDEQRTVVVTRVRYTPVR